MSIDVDNADKLLSTTRGVRRRLDFDRPVPREVIERCVEIAMQAPVGSSWITHFIAVTDGKTKLRIGELYAEVAHPYLDEMEAGQAAKSADPGRGDALAREMRMHRWYTDNLHRAPVLMIVAMQGRYERAEVARQAAVYGSTLPAAWSFMLALRARGLGTCWTTLHIRREREVAGLLGLPEDITQTALLPVAYYTGSDFKPARRPPTSDWLHWDGW